MGSRMFFNNTKMFLRTIKLVILRDFFKYLLLQKIHFLWCLLLLIVCVQKAMYEMSICVLFFFSINCIFFTNSVLIILNLCENFLFSLSSNSSVSQMSLQGPHSILWILLQDLSCYVFFISSETV